MYPIFQPAKGLVSRPTSWHAAAPWHTVGEMAGVFVVAARVAVAASRTPGLGGTAFQGSKTKRWRRGRRLRAMGF
jgi:hypothetical protein